jgi:serine/threonine-protein kinase
MLAGLARGSVVAGYRVESRIGAGGMAVVFRAYDEVLGRSVALKVLAPALVHDAQFRERFIRESRAVAAVDHPHIIPVYAAGEADGVLYLAMRFVPGGDLRAVLGREGPLTGDRAIALLAPIASALDVAHAYGLVHRDVKPANILVDARPGRPEHPYLSDFGLVKGAMASAGLTRTGQVLGTPNYVAPEQISGELARPQTDQYSLACVAYTLLTGTMPFARDDTMAVLWAHMYDTPPSLLAQRPDQPSAVDEVFTRALAKSPEDRYGTCEELIGALRTAFGVSPQALPGARTGPRPAATPQQPELDSAAAPESLPRAQEPVPPSALSLPPAILSASSLPAAHAETAIALPPSDASTAAEEPAGKPDPDDEQAPEESIDLPAPRVPQPEPEDDSDATIATVTSARLATRARDSDQPTTADAVASHASAGTEPSADDPAAQVSQKRPRRRHRVLITATVASVAAVAGAGALLAAHPWIHPVLKPTGLTVESDTTDHAGTADSVEITWSGPATGPLPDSYEIFRNSTEIGTVLGTKTSYTDDGLTPNASYGFQVIAVRGGTQSPASATLTVQPPPLRPAGLGVKAATTSSLEIAWSGPAAGPPPADYEILRDSIEITTVPGSITSYTDKGLAPDTGYSYQVIAVTGSKRSPSSAILTSASTTKPPLSAAVLNWSGQVTEKMTSLNPAEPSWPLQPGQSTQDTWTFTPDCSSGPCNATLTGAYDGYPFTTTLTRSGATYTGTAELKNDYYCETKSNVYSGTLTINVTVNAAETDVNIWTATSFSGNETENAPAAYNCSAVTDQLDVKSS